MRVTICFFSGTGNTWWAVREFAKLIASKTAESDTVAVFSIESPELSDASKIQVLLSRTDHLVVAYPVYSSFPPEPMQSFLRALPAGGRTLPVTVIATQASMSGDGAWNAHRYFARPYRVVRAFHLNLGNNFYVPDFPYGDERDPSLIASKNAKALAVLENESSSLINGTSRIVGRNPAGFAVGMFQRVFGPSLMRKVKKHFSVDMSACVGCMQCVRNCPTAAIRHDGQTFSFSDACALCMRCYNRCPVNAVLCGSASRDVARFYRYRGPVDGLRTDDLKK